MGNQVCQQCKTFQSNPNYLSNMDATDPDLPDPNYAFPENIKYQVLPEANHLIDDLMPIEIPEHFRRGRKFTRSYFIIPYSVYYVGEWLRGKPQGEGEVVFKSGAILHGTFEDGVVEGPDCLFIMESGSYYRGNMVNNRMHGKGSLVDPNNHSYEGMWQNNVPHGQGVQKYANGDTYEGGFEEGSKKGKKCVYNWKNHAEYLSYTGQFDEEYFKGQGKLIKTDGTTITGIFNSPYDIEKAEVSNSLYEYHGKLINGHPEGQGIMEFIQRKQKYQGSFQQGQLHGSGTLTTADGQIITGNWHKGKHIAAMDGLSNEEIDQCLQLIEKQFQENDYLEDAINGINESLKQAQQRSRARILENSVKKTIRSSKYIVVEMGSHIVCISEQ